MSQQERRFRGAMNATQVPRARVNPSEPWMIECGDGVTSGCGKVMAWAPECDCTVNGVHHHLELPAGYQADDRAWWQWPSGSYKRVRAGKSPLRERPSEALAPNEDIEGVIAPVIPAVVRCWSCRQWRRVTEDDGVSSNPQLLVDPAPPPAELSDEARLRVARNAERRRRFGHIVTRPRT